jgi:hypothetical protein
VPFLDHLGIDWKRWRRKTVARRDFDCPTFGASEPQPAAHIQWAITLFLGKHLLSTSTHQPLQISVRHCQSTCTPETTLFRHDLRNEHAKYHTSPIFTEDPSPRISSGGVGDSASIRSKAVLHPTQPQPQPFQIALCDEGQDIKRPFPCSTLVADHATESLSVDNLLKCLRAENLFEYHRCMGGNGRVAASHSRESRLIYEMRELWSDPPITRPCQPSTAQDGETTDFADEARNSKRLPGRASNMTLRLWASPRGSGTTPYGDAEEGKAFG